ncbi:MAG: hypothetical protein Q8Q39_00755, partial [bacterium]|nr:hypothetical protein [bacterium]
TKLVGGFMPRRYLFLKRAKEDAEGIELTLSDQQFDHLMGAYQGLEPLASPPPHETIFALIAKLSVTVRKVIFTELKYVEELRGTRWLAALEVEGPDGEIFTLDIVPSVGIAVAFCAIRHATRSDADRIGIFAALDAYSEYKIPDPSLDPGDTPPASTAPRMPEGDKKRPSGDIDDAAIEEMRRNLERKPDPDGSGGTDGKNDS